jgi:hypothetical protein
MRASSTGTNAIESNATRWLPSPPLDRLVRVTSGTPLKRYVPSLTQRFPLPF